MCYIFNQNYDNTNKLWRERGLSVLLSNESHIHVPLPGAPLGTPQQSHPTKWGGNNTQKSSCSQRLSPFKASLTAMTITASHSWEQEHIPPQRSPAFQVATLGLLWSTCWEDFWSNEQLSLLLNCLYAHIQSQGQQEYPESSKSMSL